MLATVNFIVTLSLTLVFISCQLILQIELRNNLFFSFLYKASLTGPPTLYLKYLQREMLKENCFQFPLTFIFDRPPRAIYCFIRDFLDIWRKTKNLMIFFGFLMIPQTGVLILQRRFSSMLIPIYSWYRLRKKYFFVLYWCLTLSLSANSDIEQNVAI